MAMLKLYEGAVYMHEGRTFVVQQCDTEKHFAKVLRNDVSYYTEPRDHTRVTILGRTGAREASTAFVVDPWSSARNTSAVVVEQEPRGGRAPSECVVVMHGRVRVKKEIYGYRYAVLLLVSGGSIQWEHPIGLIDHTTLSTSNTLPEMKCWEHVEPKLMAVPRPMSFSGIILAGKSELLILK